MKEAIVTANAPAAIGPYSQAVKDGDLIFVSGQLPVDPKTGEFPSEDIQEQTRQSMENIKNVLKELGVEAEVTHCDLSSAAGNKSDIYVGTRDIATQLVGLGGEVVSLNNMIDKQELKEKITAAVEKVSQG